MADPRSNSSQKRTSSDHGRNRQNQKNSQSRETQRMQNAGNRAAPSAQEKEVSSAFRAPSRPTKASPARLAALDVCRAVRERQAYAQDVIATRIDHAPLSPEDRAFATLLVLGVISSSGTLDEVIDRALRSPDDVQEDVRDALRVATYEIIYLDKTPHAAVDQGVELVRFVQPRAAGLGNAVLRKVVGMKSSFPFGDPARDLASLARLHAFPIWLAKRLVTDIGLEAAVAFMVASNEPAPLFVAVNEIKASVDEVRELFIEAGAEVSPVELEGLPVDGCLRISDGRILQDGRIKRLFAQGKVLVSDAASQLVSTSVLPERMPASFLEIGAGRGTKTILLQNAALRKYGSPLELTALDNHAFKTELLHERVAAYDTSVHAILTGDATDLKSVVGKQQFEAVFIDAPCSGLGTLRRHPEIRWRLTEQRISELATLGLSFLRSAAPHVAKGGHLAYATCTITHAENNGVVKRFLESPEGSAFKLAPIAERSCIALPLRPGSSDAHFAVRFVRVR